jgi:hypothetical protein
LTTAAPGRLRTVAFGTLDGGPWGAAWLAESPIVVLAASAGGPPRRIPGATITGPDQGEDWRLAADGLELDLSGDGEPAPIATDEAVVGFEQLCRARGHAVVDGSELTVDCPGLRGAHHDLDLGAYQSIRRVSAWFDSGEGIALLALRPRKAKGHGRDVMRAALLGSDGPAVVADPRLSTTYTADGAPARAGLELWLDDEDSEQYPRRAAGEAVGAPARLSDHDLELRAAFFRWHRRGGEGAGVYLLAQAG